MGATVSFCSHRHDPDELFDELFETGELIGEGHFSQVYYCWRHDGRDDVHALKLISLSPGDVNQLKQIQEEVDILRTLGSHPGIVQLIYADVQPEEGCVRLVMNLCEGGELYDRLQSLTYYSEKEARALVNNLLFALEYIHSKGIMHRDIKPENILLVSMQSNTTIKVSDFGLALRSQNYPRQLPRSRLICGSDYYLAPEIIKQEEYGREVDIWSTGVVTYVLFAGQLPFYSPDLQVLYRIICECKLSFDHGQWDNVSTSARDFVQELMQINADDRPTAEKALAHPWILELAGSFIEDDESEDSHKGGCF